MDKVRQRKLDARAHRQESLHPITEKTVVHVPSQKNVIVKDNIKINKLPKVTETIKRGPGRPPKAVSEKINTKKAISGNKKPVSAKGKK